MSLIDFILNLAGLLLWVSWRSIDATGLAYPGVSLVKTIKPAEPPRSRWLYLGMLGGLLFIRALFYWQIGPSLPWHPCMPLGPTSLVFRSDLFWRMIFFSFFSFGASLAIFYIWLLALSVVNSRLPEDDLEQKLVRLHLGRFEEFPGWVKSLLPFAVVLLVWLALHPLLVQFQIAPGTDKWHLLGQGALIGVAVYLSLKFLLIGLLLLYVLNSYVYLGELPFWRFVNSTGRNLLMPLQALPLRVGKIDLAPLAAIMLVMAFAFALSWVLNKIYPFLVC